MAHGQRARTLRYGDQGGKSLAACTRIGQSGRMTTTPEPSAVHFEGSVANIGRDWSMTIAAAPPGPPRRIDGYTIGAIPNIEGPGPHGGEVHPDGDEFLYVVSGTMELILDDGDERVVGAEMTVLLRSGDAYIVPRGVWHRLEAVEPSYLVHVTPGPNGGHRPR
jgi:mannose-6-phosphate isomerase-like protein (cupin superfamily)